MIANSIFTINTPSIKAASVLLIILEKSFSLSEIFLIILKTQILPIEKEIPIKINQIFRNQNSLTKGMVKLHNVQIINAILSEL